MFCLTKVMRRRFSHCVFIHLDQLLAYHVWSHRVMMLPMQDKHKAGFWTRIMDDFAKGVACDSTFWLSMFSSRKWHEREESHEKSSFRIQMNKTSFVKQNSTKMSNRNFIRFWCIKFNNFFCQKKNPCFFFVRTKPCSKARGEARELPYRSGPNKPVVGTNPDTESSSRRGSKNL